MVGAVLFAGAGALARAYAGERWKGRPVEESLCVGNAAFWARLLGTLGKTLLGGVMRVRNRTPHSANLNDGAVSVKIVCHETRRIRTDW